MLPGYLPSSYWSAPVRPFGSSRNALFDAQETSGTSAAARGPYRTDMPPWALSVMPRPAHTAPSLYPKGKDVLTREATSGRARATEMPRAGAGRQSYRATQGWAESAGNKLSTSAAVNRRADHG